MVNLVPSIAIAAPSFDDFWLLYPHRVAKKDARKAWARLTAAQHMAAIVACANWRHIWAQKDIQYLPHPATWLNGERWDDELPSSAAVHPSQVQAQLPAQGERTIMPDHVRALLARLRK